MINYARDNWNKLTEEEKRNVLSSIFTDMTKDALNELSQLSFDDLPDHCPSTWKNIPASLILAATKDGFSAEEENRFRKRFNL